MAAINHQSATPGCCRTLYHFHQVGTEGARLSGRAVSQTLLESYNVSPMDSKDKNPKKYGSAVFHGGVL
jgi:hypothetical protein